MISTGVKALDSRVGPLRRGGLCTLFGPGAAGKSVMGLHLLIEGMERGERCVLVTRDEPALIDSRAAFMGYAGSITDHPHLRILRMPPTLPSADPAADHSADPAAEGAALLAWLKAQFEGASPDRVVLDSVEWMAACAAAPRPLLEDVAGFLALTGATTYALIRTESGRGPDTEAFAPLIERSDGVFSLEVSQQGERRFGFLAAPPDMALAEPFGFSLRMGMGFCEELAVQPAELTPEDRRRVFALDEAGVLSVEVVSGLARQYELTLLHTFTGALARLAAGNHGALVIAVDPYDETRAFDLVCELRKAGNAAPIVLVSPSGGLRSATRARGLRVGGDDFFLADLPAAEILERIHLAWSRGRHQPGTRSHAGRIVQPVGRDRSPRVMTEPEFRQAMGILLAEQPPLFFCFLEFTLDDAEPGLVWPALRACVRIGDGDFVGSLGGQRVGCVLDRMTLEQTGRVVARIRAAHPSLRRIADVRVTPSPSDADMIQARLGALAGDVAARGLTA